MAHSLYSLGHSNETRVWHIHCIHSATLMKPEYGTFMVIKMLVLVVIMFGLCWLPLHTFFLVIDFNPHLLDNQTETQERLFTVIFYSAFWLAMSNSCANPVIYGFTNESFR
ncbi:Tachykinin-like peptides receptor 99D, partial [Bulinus truncatus]